MLNSFTPLLGAVLTAVAIAPVYSAPPPKASIVEEFEFIADDDPLTVPVALRGVEHLFVLDTGATFSIYDKELRPHLGARRSKVTSEAADHLISAELFDPPDAHLGILSLRSATGVAALDLQNVRDALKQNIRGIIGMDFLRYAVVRIDFDAERIYFLSSVPQDSGERFIISNVHGRPYVDVDIAGWGRTRFLVDTGHCTAEEGAFKSPLFSTLSAQGVITSAKEVEIADLVARRHNRSGFLAMIRLGHFRHSGLRVGSIEHATVLGLRYWARYVATWDFPNQRLYLKRSERFDVGVPDDLSGMSFVRIDGRFVVKSIKAGQVADRAGLRVGDLLLRVDELDVGNARLQDVRAKLCREGNLEIVASRNERRFKTILSLSKPVARSAKAMDENRPSGTGLN